MNSKPVVHNQEYLDRLIDENFFLRSSLEKTDQGKELIRQREEFSLLLAVSKLIVSELNLGKVFQLVADKARDLVKAEMVLVPMLNEQRDRYTYVAASGADAETVLNANFPVTVGMCGWVLQHERSLLFGESSLCWLDETTAWEKGQQSAVLVPLFGRKQIIGGLSALGKQGGGSFTSHDLDLLTMFANQVSAAIENAILFEQVQREVVERRQAEIALRESEQSYKTLSENLPGLVYRIFLRENNRMKFFNTTRIAMTGYSEREMLSGDVSSIIALIVPEDRTNVVDEIQRAIMENRPFSVEYRLRHKDGTIRYFSELGATIPGNDDKPLYIDGVIFDMTERKRAEEQIIKSLREKEVLLKEVHHRVKNNMQVICSLLNLQAKGIADKAIRALFEESRNRVSSMALIHEKLYKSKDLAHIDFREYLQSLVAGIAATYKRHDVDFVTDMEQVALTVNVGIPCGLIVNELISNSLKHAFPEGRRGTIKVGVNRKRDGDYVLSVEDNGVGFPPELDFRTTPSLGLQLVNVLTGQIRGTIELVKAEGSKFKITFPG